ncbi:MAG: YeeE/YedE family protein [Pseudomonadota bacterium]|nr:YeeE/YedE family protein [Pseudomonadota bacterium]
MNPHIVSSAAALFCGTLFGAGLTLSAMVNPEKVLNFLDVLGHWDPSLALVMGGAVAVTLVAFPLVLRRPRPWFGARFHLPQKSTLDARLLIGAAFFGVGWGLAGYCPGPALAALSFGRLEPLVFVLAMAVGSWIAGRVQQQRA